MIKVDNLKKIIEGKAEFDNVQDGVEDFSEVVADYKLYHTLVSVIEMMMNAKELEVNTLSSLFDLVTDGMSEEEESEFEFVLIRFLQYIKVPQNIIDDLVNGGDEVEQDEFENLIELLEARIGDGDIYTFVAYALNNAELDSIDFDTDFDSVEMDWAFYGTIEACKKGDGLREVPKSKNQKCKKGFSKGRKGFWRYPEGDFPNGQYKRKEEGSREKGKTIANFKGKDRHASKSDKNRSTDMKKRNKAGMNVFSGYLKTKKADKKVSKAKEY